MTRPEDNELLAEVQAWLDAHESKPRVEILAAIACIVGIVLALFVLHLGAS